MKTKSNSKQPSFSELVSEVAQPAQRRMQAVEFAGFMIREDEDSLYISDPQGTWIVRRKDVTFLEDWKRCVPESLNPVGKPVRVGVREGATIHEIRPWQIRKAPGGLGGGDVRQAIEGIFSLGGAPLPIGERTILGERQMASLERMFSRRLGWGPDICDDPQANPRANMVAHVSKTIVVSDGYTDVDEGF